MKKPDTFLLLPGLLLPGLLLPGLLLLVGSVGPAQEGPSQSAEIQSVQTLGGKVSLRELGTGQAKKPGSSPVALFQTEAPLMQGELLLPPGEYKISFRRKKGGKAELLLTREGAMPATVPLRGVPRRKGVITPPAKGPGFRLSSERDRLGLELHTSRESFGTRFLVLRRNRISEKLGGKAATFEFYGIPASKLIQSRVRDGRRFLIGRAWQEGEAGIRFDIQCQRSGAEILVVCHNVSLQQAEHELEKHRQQLQLQEEILPRLERRLEAARAFRDTVLIGGAVEKVKDHSKELRITVSHTTVSPTTVSPTAEEEEEDKGFVIHLHFGLRRASFPVRDQDFLPLRWR